MFARKTITVPLEVLNDYMERILRAAGCEPSIAKTAAEIFLEADMRGVGLQGLDHMHTMVRAIQKGHIDPCAVPTTIKQGAAFALIDGARGPGQIAALLATDIAVAKARQAGSCCVGVFNSSDIFMLGFYAERIGRAGLLGLVFTGSPPQVHPFGGIEKVLGTNPLAIAVPTENNDPLLIDLATSSLSGSRIRQASYFGEEVPEGIGVDADGVPTTDPNKIRLGGAIAPLAGHKGFALSLVIGLMTGPLVGAQAGAALRGWSSQEKGPQGSRGHFVLAIDPGSFGDPQVFRRAATAYLEEIRASRKEPGVSVIRIPGERAFETRRRSLLEGVVLYQAVWERATELAQELGVSVPTSIRMT